MVKIAVLVSGGGTNLQALIDRQQAGELGCGQIGLVLSSRPGVYALERAQKAGIETVVVDRKSCATPRNSAPGCCISCRAAAWRWWCWQDF